MPRQKRHASRIYQLVGEPGPGTQAVGYVRYSSDMQRPASIATQKSSIQHLADKKAWVIIAWYEEPEQSAKFEEEQYRLQFTALLKAAGASFKVVIYYDTCRWSRNVEVGHRSIRTLRQKGVWWQTSEERWTINNIQEPGLSSSFGFALQQAQDYLLQLSKSTIPGKEQRALDGFHNGKVPFGYLPPEYPKAPDGAPSTWRPPRVAAAPDPANFPALVRIGELAAQGWTDAAIAEQLVGHLSVTPRFGQRALTKDTIAAIR